MENPQYAILRFAKYKGPEISRIEAHDERTKETYASNPDVDTARSHLNYHLIEPKGHYRQEAESKITDAGCRIRSDSVRLVETLITGSPDFFKGKTDKQIKAYFQHALVFLQEHQRPDTFVSAVVHMDEKTPHMHVIFVPLTEDNRLTAKEIIGNRKKLTQWQDDYWRHMVSKYPELERGQNASQTGRDHIPPRIFKEMTRLTKQRQRIEEVLGSINPFNGKAKATEIRTLLDKYIPNVERMHTQLKKYNVAFTDTTAENAALKEQNASLEAELDARAMRALKSGSKRHSFTGITSRLKRCWNGFRRRCWICINVRGVKIGRPRGMRLYDDPSDQAAFERWVDVTAQLLQKYGPILLKQKKAQPEQESHMENNSPLESEKEAA